MSERDRVAAIRTRLEQAFATTNITIQDDSHLHAGHAGARAGGGHFTVTLCSDRFAGLQPLARHRLVYEALSDMLQKDIHALSIKALAPDDR
jgi:BolA protein